VDASEQPNLDRGETQALMNAGQRYLEEMAYEHMPLACRRDSKGAPQLQAGVHVISLEGAPEVSMREGFSRHSQHELPDIIGPALTSWALAASASSNVRPTTPRRPPWCTIGRGMSRSGFAIKEVRWRRT